MDCCGEGTRWTLSTLVGSFLDLAIACLLLCCSALSFLAAHFLSFFGLRLPCPHFHAFLLQSPSRAIASVQASALTRFPFRRCEVGGEEGGVLEDRGSVDDGRRGDVVLLRDSDMALGFDGFPSSPPPPPPQLDWLEPSRSPSPRNFVQSGVLSVYMENCGVDDGCNSDAVLNWEVREDEGMKKTESHRLDRSDPETIRILERALEEERSARSAVYSELDKERSSAATAANEAMAMIERLQKEKATVEMDVKQYQRMVEEKTTYDEEEMENLKEIIVRQEKELYVLRKEVDMLQQMVVSSGDAEGNVQHAFHEDHELVRVRHSSSDLDGDPSQMPHQVSDSNEKKQEAKGCDQDLNQTSSYAEGSEIHPLNFAECSSSSTHDGKERAEAFDSSTHLEQLPLNADEDNMDFQEKGIVSVDMYASDTKSQTSKSNDVTFLAYGGAKEDHDKIEVRSQHDKEVKEKNGDSSHFMPESRPFDVHVISDQILLGTDGDGKRKISWADGDVVDSQDCCDLPSDDYGSRNIEIMSHHSSTGSASGEQKIRRYRSDSECVHSTGTSSFDLSGNTTSPVDSERTRLESEVEGLKERHRVIQQGRQKLNSSVENVQKENFHLQLLQEIALQLKEIRQLSSPGKVASQASLPLPSSNVWCSTKEVYSRKIRSRSDSQGQDGCN